MEFKNVRLFVESVEFPFDGRRIATIKLKDEKLCEYLVTHPTEMHITGTITISKKSKGS